MSHAPYRSCCPRIKAITIQKPQLSSTHGISTISLNLLMYRSYPMRHTLPRLFNEAFLVHHLVLHSRDSQRPLPLTAPTKYQAIPATASPCGIDTKSQPCLQPLGLTRGSNLSHTSNCSVQRIGERCDSPIPLKREVTADTITPVRQSKPLYCR